MFNLRLRAINDQKPRSSMRIGHSAQTDRSDTSRDERSNKRIKKSGPEPSCASRFLTGSRLAPLEAIENDSEPSAKAPWHHNLTRESSYVDTIGGSSVVSTSNLTTAAGSSVPEYRSVQRRSTVKRSRRRARGPRKVVISSGESDDDTVAVAHRNLPPQHSPTLTSPDCLSMNAHNDCDDPPPTNISSDLPLQSKRSATDDAQSTPKRYRLYNDSEDELARPVVSTGSITWPTSVTKPVTRSPHSRIQRGDIKPTNFGSAMGRRNSTRSGPKADVVRLVAAASGKNTWSSGKTDEPIVLHLDSSLALPSHQGGQTLSWLELPKTSIRSAKHSNSKSSIILIHRSTSGPTTSSKLVLKFSDISNASIFISWLHGVENLKEIIPSDLENIFSRTMAEAKSFASKSKNSPIPISPVPFTANTPRPPQSSHRDPFKGEPISPRRSKLKDRMQGGLPILQEEVKEEVKMKTEDVEDPFLEPSRKRKPETRQTRKSSPEPFPLSWTAQNTGWEKDWHRSLVYPPTGKNRATVDKEDIIRLDEGEFLNDNLISFYLRYLQVQLEKERPEILEKVYIFNTFFFEKLRSNRAKINYEGVKAWTSRVDLLSYDYIVVPVNENAHWYLAIIYNAPRLLPNEVKAEASKKDESSSLQDAIIVEDNDPGAEVAENVFVKKASPVVSLDHEAPRSTRSQAATGGGVVLLDNGTVKNPEAPNKTNKRKSTGGNQKYSTDEPRIITLDSLGAAHGATCKCLRDYLVQEAKDKKGIDITETPGGMTARGIPEQDNHCDCGVYVLGYMENFLKDPDEAVRRLLQKEASQWDIKPNQIRAKVRGLLFDFQKEQHLRLEKEKALKRKRRATKGPVSSPQVAPSSPQVPPRAPETPQANHGPKGTLVNDTVLGESEEPPHTGTTSAYFTVASPEKPVRPETPTRNKDPSFVQPLREGSSNDSKISSSGDIFHSARSSPVDTSQKVLPDLTTEGHSPRIERNRPKPPSTPNFVQKLSESPQEAGSASISSTVKRNSSPSVTLATKQRVSTSPAPDSQSAFDGERIIMKSIEDPFPKEPQHDMVERTIDLTG